MLKIRLGVGGWAEQGVDPANYSRSLMTFAEEAVSQKSISDPSQILTYAYEKCKVINFYVKIIFLSEYAYLLIFLFNILFYYFLLFLKIFDFSMYFLLTFFYFFVYLFIYFIYLFN